MDEMAVVREVHPGQIVVESKVKSTCSQCQQVDSCASGQVASALPHKTLSVMIDTHEDVEDYIIGEQVIISIPENTLLSVAWQVYLLPLFGLIIAGGFGQYLFSQSLWLNAEWQAILLSLFGGYLGHYIAKWLQSKAGIDKTLVPEIKQRVIATHSIES